MIYPTGTNNRRMVSGLTRHRWQRHRQGRWKAGWLLLLVMVLPLTGLAEKTAATSLHTTQVRLEKVDREFPVFGRIEAVHQATVSAQTSGRVVAIRFDTGDYVKKGDVLVIIRSRTQQARMEEAEANYREALNEFNRISRIYKQKLVAKSVFDRAQARLRVTRSGLARAKEELSRTEIRAPYNGIVVKRHVETGETANPGQALMTGLSLEQLRVHVEVPQSVLPQVQKHRQVYLQAGNKRILLSKLSFSPFADPGTHTFALKASLPRGTTGFYPGALTKVVLVTGKTEKLLIPASAVIRRSEVTGVYVMDAKGKLALRQIKAGASYKESYTEVLSGLEVGEKIVLNPIRAAALRKQRNN